jgi:hypothetical protein
MIESTKAFVESKPPIPRASISEENYGFLQRHWVTVRDLKIMPPGLLGEASVLATFRLEGWSGEDIQVNPRLRTQIGCNELPAPIDASDTFDMRIVWMINAVNLVITSFENYY